jgi:hypothetical protein
MSNNYSRDAKFDNVKFDPEAVMFHTLKYEMGFKYPLSIACYQMTQIIKMKEEKLNDDNAKP